MKIARFFAAIGLVILLSLTACKPISNGLPSDNSEESKLNFTVKETGWDYVVFEWDEETSSECKKYYIQCKTEGYSRAYCFSDYGKTIAEISGLDSNTSYVFELQALNIDYAPISQEEVTVKTLKAGPVRDFSTWYSTETNSIVLSWAKINSKAMITSVSIERTIKGSDDYKVVTIISGDEIFTETSYRDFEIIPGEFYEYKIITVDDEDNQYVKFSECECQYSKPNKPNNFTVKKTLTSMVFSWDPVVGATGYILYKNTFSFGTPTKYVEVTETTYTEELSMGTSYGAYYCVAAVNPKGESNCTDYIQGETLRLSSVTPNNYSRDTTENSAVITVNEIPDDIKGSAEIFYGITDKYLTDSTIKNFDQWIVISDTGILELENLELAKAYNYYCYVVAKQELSNGSVNVASNYLNVKFQTKGFDAPEEVTVSDVKRTIATVDFNALTDFKGKNESDIRYKIVWTEKGKDITNSLADYKWTGYGEKGPAVISGLSPDTEYIVAVWAQFRNQDYQVTGDFSESVSFTTKSKINPPELIDVSEVLGWPIGSQTRAQLSFVKSFDDFGGEEIDYSVQYKIQNAAKWKTVSDENKNYYESLNKITVGGLNAGNRYVFRIGAAAAGDPESAEYSEEKYYQFEKISEENLSVALTFPEDIPSFDVKAGDVIDISKGCVFVGSDGKPATIRSTDLSYNFGVLDFISNANPNLVIPTGTDTYGFKLDISNNFEGAKEERLILLMSSLGSQINWEGKKLANCNLYFLDPSTDGVILYEPKLFTELKIPTFNSSGATTMAPSSAGMVIPEEYIFNNSIYIGVKVFGQNTGYVAFSYYY